MLLDSRKIENFCSSLVAIDLCRLKVVEFDKTNKNWEFSSNDAISTRILRSFIVFVAIFTWSSYSKKIRDKTKINKDLKSNIVNNDFANFWEMYIIIWLLTRFIVIRWWNFISKFSIESIRSTTLNRLNSMIELCTCMRDVCSFNDSLCYSKEFIWFLLSRSIFKIAFFVVF